MTGKVMLFAGSGELVVSWGRGEDGQLGHGDAEERNQPQTIFGLLNQRMSSVHCGAEYSLAISHEHRQIWSWGWGDFGRLGHGDCGDVFVPRPIAALAGIPIASAACGDTHTLVLSEAGEVYAFGRNQNGQLGTGSDVDSLVPLKLTALEVRPLPLFAGSQQSHKPRAAAACSAQVALPAAAYRGLPLCCTYRRLLVLTSAWSRCNCWQTNSGGNTGNELSINGVPPACYPRG